MTPAEIEAALVRLIDDAIPGAHAAALGPDDDLRDALDVDSMDFLKVVQRIHDELGIDVPERDYRKLATLRSAVEYLSRMRAP